MVRRLEVVVVGAGIVGLATARALLRRRARCLLVLEAEGRPAWHQTGHNSGVLHSGLYYRPGSDKARWCGEGRRRMVQYCQARGVPFELCGKLVVATDDQEAVRLDELQERGRQNGLQGVRRVDAAALREREPHVRGVAGLLVPETGIVDYTQVARCLAEDVVEAGGEVSCGQAFLGARREGSLWRVQTRGEEIEAELLVTAAGLQADRVARRAGLRSALTVVPFRGEYHELAPERSHLVRHLVYPVPDPRFPFLGVHFTRHLDGSVEAGPNAVLAFARHGYRWSNVRIGDLASLAVSPGFWRLALRHGGMAVGEYWRSFSKAAFTRALQHLVPEIQPTDLQPGGAGVRAQALDRKGRLVDDFVVEEAPGLVHVANAPSPAATASLVIGEEIARRVDAHPYVGA